MASFVSASEAGTDLLILQPAIRPERSGVTDHGLALAEKLAARGVTVQHLDIADAAQRARIATIPHAAVLLQFSPYGYHSRGVPLWLPRFLADARRRAPGRTWITYFHELWTWGEPIYRSAFWLSPWQRRVCLDVMAASDLAIFNSLWGLEIGRSRLGERACFMPTASNIGEPAVVTNLAERAPSLVVFGSARSRMRCYADTVRLATFMRRSGLDRIIDIGEPLGALPSLPSGIAVETLGLRPSAEVSRRLLDARYGLFEAPWGVASKSSVFAAYRAHGVVPVAVRTTADMAYRGAPGPEIGADFITLDTAALPPTLGGPFLRTRYGHASFDRLAEAIEAQMRS